MGLAGLRSSTQKDDLSKSSKRRIEKKLNFIAKITESITSLGAKKTISKKKKLRSRQKKLKAYDLSVLSEFLPDPALKNASRTTVLKVNCKNRQKLVQRETEALRSVHDHPVFQADPISAIQQHLEQTQPPPPLEKRVKRSKKDKRKKSKLPTAGLQSMEV
ncbi:hypothetical protein KSP39_PZI023979 [Platanthera zijinensis]|uniref:Ribosome biogenesis protein slx9-like n=1 Tax=Platanthera zijinensis TaxID=2320716 RepID=A0AAP0ASI7_9ASPA